MESLTVDKDQLTDPSLGIKEAIDVIQDMQTIGHQRLHALKNEIIQVRMRLEEMDGILERLKRRQNKGTPEVPAA